jgi:predicted ATPase
MHQDKVRLLTIVGPGGLGKTRLALACAAQVLGDSNGVPSAFPHGLYFVNLAPLSEAAHIVPTLADAMHFPLQGGERDQRSPKQQVLDYLREKRMLLVLDNFEHLLEGANLVADILQTAAQVKILVTSRERLHLRQEQVYPIQGLEFPETILKQASEFLEEAEAYAAVKLFIQAAQRTRPDFHFNGSDDLTNLARICRLVEGMPLALELAAAWVDTLPLATIAREIQASLDFLESEMRDAPVRHRSIRAAIDCSWQKLMAAEQTIFAQLSVFRGGFTRQAGQTITSASLPLLARLVNKSFLQYYPARDRYQMHELMRQFGMEKLATDREAETALRNQHSAYYCWALLLHRRFERIPAEGSHHRD